MRKVGGKAAVPVKAPAKKPAASAKAVEVNPTIINQRTIDDITDEVFNHYASDNGKGKKIIDGGKPNFATFGLIVYRGCAKNL